MDEFHFLRPWWLLALLPFGLAVWWYLRARHRGGAWSRVCDAALLPYIVQNVGRSGTGVAGWLAFLAGALASVALAGPVWERLPVPVFRGDSALVIALDLSASMNATDIQPSRLERAKFKIADILHQRTTGQTALVVYAAQSFVVTPLTDDAATLTAQLQALDSSIMPRQGSEPAAALDQAATLLRQAGMPGGHVLLITDGVDGDALERALSAAASGDYRLSVLAVGTPEGAPIPEAGGGFARTPDGEIVMSTLAAPALRALATAGQGLYVEAAVDDREIERIFAFLARDNDANHQRLRELAANQWHEVGPWLLLPVLPLAALAFRRGVLLVALVLALQLGPPAARAGWWQTPDQAGQRAFTEGDYAAAARRFENPGWRGAAHYRAGDFDAAAADYAAADSADAHYNRGNTLARQGRYADALQAYDEALKRAPGDEDARHNKALIEQELKKQAPSEQQQQGQSDQRAEQSPGQRAKNQDSGEQGDSSEELSAAAADAGGGARSKSKQHSESRNDAQQNPEQAEQDRRAERPAAASDEESEDAPELASAQSESASERARATEQWLRQIPDDPAGLLRRKFQYQYKQMYGDRPYRGNEW